MAKDLFTPVTAPKLLHPLFERVRDSGEFRAARELMNLIFAEFHDVDKSFVREFQTGGFSARVFELALFAYLQEQGLELDRSEPAPDFVVRGDHPVGIEVTTTNPPQNGPQAWDEFRWFPEDLPAADRAFVFQLGKALRKKLLHRDAQGRAYWEKPHVGGLPFVIAVGAFHDEHAQWYPMGLVSQYLYGRRDVFVQDADGNRVITHVQIAEHESNGKTIPSGLFRQPEAAHLSGVLFSNAHTMAMFNRIGTSLELGDPDVALCRIGVCYDPAPDAVEPQKFAYAVGDRAPGDHETFAEGLHLFLNPWAKRPLSPTALPSVTFHELEDGVVVSNHTGGLQPIVSKTVHFTSKDAGLLARYYALRFLGVVPDVPELFDKADDAGKTSAAG